VGLNELGYADLSSFLYDIIASYNNICPYSLDTSILKCYSLESSTKKVVEKGTIGTEKGLLFNKRLDV